MSRFRTTGAVSKSVPFAGLSIGRQIKNSAYGMFEDSLTHIESIMPAANFHLKLPRVIVVGERSVGKSSLLENFTECAIFPRGKGTCTKMPVRLQIKAVTSLPKYVATVRYMGQPDINLTSTDDILPAVQSLMDQAQGINANEITVEISQVDGATFTFVDLPGIQQWPSADSEISKALVTNYLTDATQDTLVLCVVDATTAADLERSAALKEIAAAGKMGNTILALTKCDEVQDVDSILAKIFDPLEEFNSCSSKVPELAGLAGCVAIANRKTEGCTLSLEQFDSNERSIFRDMITRVSHECPAMPAAFKAKLADHMTIQQLIIKLDCLYRDFIVQHWKPQTLEKLAPKITAMQAEIGALGPPVECLDAQAVLQHLFEQVDLAALCKRLAWSNYVEVADGAALWAYLSKQKQAWGTPDWAKYMAIAQDDMSNAIADQTSRGTHAACFQAFQQAFETDTFMRLSRFQTLQDHVFIILLEEQVEEGLAAAAPAIERMKQRAFDDMYCDDTKETFVKLSKGIQGCLTDQIYRRLCKPLQIAPSFVLEEASEVHAKRAELHQQLHRLQIAQQKIGNIHEAVCTETALQKDLLGLPAPSLTGLDSPQTASSNISPATSLEIGTRPNQVLSKETYNDDLQQSVVRVAEDWSSQSSSSSPDSIQLEAPLDVVASYTCALSSQTAKQPALFEGCNPTEVEKQMAIKGCLDQIMPDNFNQVFDEIIAIGYETLETVTGLADQIFNKALTDTASGEVCARLCFQLNKALPSFEPHSPDASMHHPITFRMLLLDMCQEEFCKGAAAMEAVKAHDKAEQESTNQQKQQDQAEVRNRALGNIQFVGHLYCRRMLTNKIIHECVKRLLADVDAPQPGDLECVVKLMRIVGPQMDTPSARIYMNAYFERITILSKKTSLDSPIRLMLQDLVELRRSSWVAPKQNSC